MEGIAFATPLLSPRPPLAPRALIGIIAPATNITVQPEMEALRPPGVCNQHARIANPEQAIMSDRDTLAVREAMLAGLQAAVDSLLPCRPDHLVLGVMAEQFAGGGAAGEALLQGLRARSGVGVSDWSSAMLAALAALGIAPGGRVAVLTPFMPVGDQGVRRFLEGAGYVVSGIIGLRAPSACDIARISPDRQIEALRALAATEPDAILQAGTNMPFAALAPEAERWLGRPVLAANPVTYWHGLRALGIRDPLPGAGRIGLLG
ncbi:MAG: arylmalonate decarboxylase [Rhodovarius sp.]|nr:arylmalonate decarboxylase [Rhodovarius sp.]